MGYWCIIYVINSSVSLVKRMDENCLIHIIFSVYSQVTLVKSAFKNWLIMLHDLFLKLSLSRSCIIISMRNAWMCKGVEYCTYVQMLTQWSVYCIAHWLVSPLPPLHDVGNLRLCAALFNFVVFWSAGNLYAL